MRKLYVIIIIYKFIYPTYNIYDSVINSIDNRGTDVESTLSFDRSDTEAFVKSSHSSMGSKKYLLKYGCCIFFYFFFCFALLITTTFLSSTSLSQLNLKNHSVVSLSVVSTIESIVDDNYHDYRWLGSESESEIIETIVDSQAIETSIQRISSICEKYNKTTSLERTHFLYSAKHNVLYCWIRKVASTSFTKLFADLRGIRVTGNYYKRINVLAPKNVDELVNVIDDPLVFKFLAVRHPFERLVSFYRSRIEDNSKFTDQAWIFGQKIFYLTRPKLFHFNQTTGNVLQQIFFTDRRLKLIPTFKEFIVWLLQEPEEYDDPHWSQYYSHCSVCQMQLDFILKLDSYSINDINYIFSIMGLNAKRWKLARLGDNDKGLTNFARTCFYLSKLSKNILEKLFLRYKIDFEMFDYDYNTYKSCIK